MHIQTDRAFVPAGGVATRYLSVTVTAPAGPARAESAATPARPRARVALVLDRSGSMGGSKIAFARQAVEHAVRLLKPTDELSLVVYDNEIDTLLERTPATTAAKRQARAALARVDARGSTNLSEGWFTGARSLADAPADAVSRVLLLTDGLANQGVTDAAALTEAAARFRAQGIGTSTFGLGADFDEELLTSIATHGGGHFYFIEQPGQIPDLLASELGEVLDVVARDAVFELMPGPGVGVTLLNPLPVERTDHQMRVRLGDLVAGQEMTLLVAVTASARPEGESACVDCRLGDRDRVLFPEPMRVDWAAVTPSQDREQPVNREVLVAVAEMLAEGARAQALAANRHGAWHEAGQILRDAAAAIRQLAPADAAVQDIAARLATEEGEFVEPMTAIDRKARHFVAYSLVHSRAPGGRARKA